MSLVPTYKEARTAEQGITTHVLPRNGKVSYYATSMRSELNHEWVGVDGCASRSSDFHVVHAACRFFNQDYKLETQNRSPAWAQRAT